MLVEIVIAFVTSFLGTLVGILGALWVERARRPHLRITCPTAASTVGTYPPQSSHAGETWKFTRVSVENPQFSSPLFRWIPRYTAENCWAQLEFRDSRAKTLFTMKGRWASSPELPHLPKDSWVLKTVFPDPVTISAGAPGEPLDVVAQCEYENAAYAWNAEAYHYNWRAPHYRLDEGDYRVVVTVGSQNGPLSVQELELRVAANFVDTMLRAY